MNFLKQSTASQIRTIGAFVDDTDFKTVENGLTIANTDIKLKKNGATAVNKNSGGATSDVNGMYALTFDATDTNTVGELDLSVDVAGALVVWKTFFVLEETVFDLYYAAAADGEVVLQGVTHTGAVIPTVTALTGNTAQTGDNFARIGVNGAGLSNIDLPNQTMDITGNITGNLSGSVGSVTGAVGSVTGAVTVGALNANVITAASINASAMDGKGDWNIGKTGYSLTQAFPTNFADMAIVVTTGELTIGTNNDKTGYSVSALASNVITAASIAASAMDGKGDWNIGKTGYTLTQSFPTNFADMAITVTTGQLTIGTNNDKSDYNIASIDANAINAASIAASAMDGKGDWNINKTGYSISGTITTFDGLNNITAADVLAAGDIDGFSLEEANKLELAALGGKLSGGATATNTIRAADDSKDRITATVDSDGNRTAVTLDGTG